MTIFFLKSFLVIIFNIFNINKSKFFEICESHKNSDIFVKEGETFRLKDSHWILKSRNICWFFRAQFFKILCCSHIKRGFFIFIKVWQGFFNLVYPYILFVRKVFSSLNCNNFMRKDYALWNVNKTIKRYVDNNS